MIDTGKRGHTQVEIGFAEVLIAPGQGPSTLPKLVRSGKLCCVLPYRKTPEEDFGDAYNCRTVAGECLV